MTQHRPTCRLCGGALQPVPSMPGHVVCGSGHLFTVEAAKGDQPAAAAKVRRVGTPSPQPPRS